MSKKITTKSTRKEVLEAYEELNARYQELESKFANMPVPEPAPKWVEPAKSVQAIEALPEQPKFSAKGSMEAVISALTELGEKFNAALSQLSTNLLVEATHLKEVGTQVDEESQRLATLYGLTITEDTLSLLLKQYADTEEEYEETLQRRQEVLAKVFTEASQAWQQEQEQTEQQLREQQATAKKNYERDQTEYHYMVQLQRETADEKYTEQYKQQQQFLKALTEERQQAWAEREKALSEREQQFKEFKEKVEQFPKALEMAIRKAKEEGAGIARHQAKVKVDFVAKEVAGEEEIYRLKVASLESEVAKQAEQIDKLSKQLETTFNQTQELAVKAIEGASTYTSFQALKEIALEQAKNPSKIK